MKAKILLILLGIIIFLTGCTGLTNEEILVKTQRYLKEMKGYQCMMKVKVTGNKGSQLYEMKQYFQSPDFYRLETLSPKHLTGKITIIEGKRAKIYHPYIEKSIIIENFTQNREESMFLGDFHTWNFEDENIEVEEKIERGEEYLVLRRGLLAENQYHHDQSLWIHKKEMIPHYMMIYDKEGNIRVEVSISDFIINPQFEESLFDIDKQ